MRNIVKLALIPAVAMLAACGRNDVPQSSMDDALKNDLSLASSAQPQQQFVSPMEQQYAQQGYGQPRLYNASTTAPAPRATPVRRTTQRSQPVYRTQGTVAREPVRHTKRDAIIGATAGAVIGATTSRDKVKGGLIGAAIGGIAGAVVGHTVDVQH